MLQCLFKNGPLGFAALQQRIEGISSEVLSENSDQLEREALIEREIVSDRPFRVEYSLTERGGTSNR